MKFSYWKFRYCNKILRQTSTCLRKKKKRLSLAEQKKLQAMLLELKQAIDSKTYETASTLAKEVKLLSKELFKMSLFDHFKESIIGIAIALVLALLIRQTWFDTYKIPSGSMRPTLQEEDRLISSKSTFGVNVPFQTSHFYFDPNLIQRTGIFIFTAEGMDLDNPDHLYFNLFPGKKKLVKRLMGKPGDSLYFYGGKIYGVDTDGNDLQELRNSIELEKLEHIPFMTLEGKVTTKAPYSGSKIHSPVYIYQMNQLVAKLEVTPYGTKKGAIYYQDKWVEEDDEHNLSSMWGFGNFGMTRILTKNQVKELIPNSLEKLSSHDYYLQIIHSPTTKKIKMNFDNMGRARPILGYETSLIPLENKHLNSLMDNMYTSRFVVKGGYAFNFSHEKTNDSSFLPRFEDVENGTYEFYYGKGYKISYGGIRKELAASHPLMQRDPENVQKLFNLGIRMLTIFEPQKKFEQFFPPRYTYFRDENLYVMGSPIFFKGDPLLKSFIKNEEQKKLSDNSYHAFQDYGPPLKNGKIDIEKIKKYGLKIPEKSYLALGDNHAGSSDSRDFGFVPEENIQGSPSFILWPPSSRWGTPNQKGYPWFTTANLAVWGIFLTGFGTWFVVSRRKK